MTILLLLGTCQRRSRVTSRSIPQGRVRVRMISRLCLERTPHRGQGIGHLEGGVVLVLADGVFDRVNGLAELTSIASFEARYRLVGRRWKVGGKGCRRRGRVA